MQIIENKKIKEKLYIEKLDNGLTVMMLPKKTNKKYVVWSANYGSIDNKFYAPGEDVLTKVPDGIAHYLEHKLFEQENGKNSLDVLTSLGVEANAYTTNDHTAFLIECTENYDEALDEFMDYVQKPYFTDENVNKERGIIEQEIMMYDDDPGWVLYINALKCLYKNNEINIDTAGDCETIQAIDKDKLYKIYNSFYRPNNMVMVLVGNFEPERDFQKIKDRMIMQKVIDEAKRVYNEEPKEIVQNYISQGMNISMPIAMVAYKDNDLKDNKIKKDIAIFIIGNVLFGKTSKFYEKLYEEGKLSIPCGAMYEYSKTFAHVLIQVQSNYLDDVLNEIESTIKEAKENGISEEDFIRSKKSVYGELVSQYNDVDTIATNFVQDYFKGANSFDYFNEFENVTKEYVEEVLRSLLLEENKAVSVIENIK